MLALLPLRGPSSLLSDHVDAALRESAKGKDSIRERDMESAAHEAVGLEGI